MSNTEDTVLATLGSKTSKVDAEPLNMKEWSVITVFVLSLLVPAVLIMMWIMTKLDTMPSAQSKMKDIMLVVLCVYFLIITIWYMVYGINRYDRKINKDGIFMP
jgi:predicted permease